MTLTYYKTFSLSAPPHTPRRPLSEHLGAGRRTMIRIDHRILCQPSSRARRVHTHSCIYMHRHMNTRIHMHITYARRQLAPQGQRQRSLASSHSSATDLSNRRRREFRRGGISIGNPHGASNKFCQREVRQSAQSTPRHETRRLQKNQSKSKQSPQAQLSVTLGYFFALFLEHREA